jgi:hypothetical protein
MDKYNLSGKAWWLWKHRYSCVFEGTVPSVPRIIQDIKEMPGYGAWQAPKD